MTNDIRAVSIAAALAAAAFITFSVADLSGARAAQVTGDFRNAAVAEVHDANGQVLLRGSFAPVDADDQGEVERKAALQATAPGSTASGEAEVEYQTDKPSEQEVECSASGLTPGAAVTFVIDGRQIATATADQRGRFEIEVIVK